MHTQLNPAATLASLATARPASIPVMERLGLDYCCGGKRTLSDACAAGGIKPEDLMAAIDAEEQARPAPEQSWERATMTELADHIEQTHHVFVRDCLMRLGAVIPRVLAAHGDREPRLRELADVFAQFVEEMHDHMVREERVVFPWLRRLERPTEIQGGPPWSVRRPISCMVHDHDDAGRALARMRALTDDYTPPPRACNTYRSMLKTLADLERDTHIHIHKENNILFPAGIRAEDQRGRAPHAGMDGQP